MLKTYVGPVESADNVSYLRPETAQAIFVQFKNVLEVSRQRVPFGICQAGKAFRNEVNPRNFTFRSREFEQMELEFFIKPDEAIAAIARYYAAQPPASGRPASSAVAMKGKELFEKGAPERGMAACARCHGKNAEGGADGPRLASQHAKYIAKQLRYIQTRERDVAIMREVVKAMTPEEAQAVAVYVQSLS